MEPLLNVHHQLLTTTTAARGGSGSVNGTDSSGIGCTSNGSGVRFIDPLFQKILVQRCKQLGLPVVFDEVRCLVVAYFYSTLDFLL